MLDRGRGDRPRPTVSVVVVNWNGEEVIEKCLDSVFALLYPIREVIVVDNGSSDRSERILAERYANRITLIRNPENLGAPVARNQGMRHAVASGVDSVFTLDNDLTIAPDAVGKLVDVQEGDTSIAMAGALILYENRPNVIQAAGNMIDWTQNLVRTLAANRRLDGSLQGSWEVDYVGSGAMLTRASFIREHGLFDESYLGYGYEDTEYGYRANRLGYRVVCVADARVWHRPHTGVGRYTYRKKYLESRNAVLFMKRHGTPWRWAKYLTFLFLGFAYAAVREGIRGNIGGVWGKMLGFFDGLRNHEQRARRLMQR